jgi:SPFH domain / Band 7 family
MSWRLYSHDNSNRATTAPSALGAPPIWPAQPVKTGRRGEFSCVIRCILPARKAAHAHRVASAPLYPEQRDEGWQPWTTDRISSCAVPVRASSGPHGALARRSRSASCSAASKPSRYRIRNPLRFYQTVGTIDGANSRLSPLLNAALRRVLGDATLTQVVRDDRAALMARVRGQLNAEAQAFGIEIVDVRISRANLPMQNSQAVYQRMQTERQREAAGFRAQGSEKSQEIRARADRDVTVLIEPD